MSQTLLGGFLSATFNPLSGTATEVEYLVVAGGGGAGSGGGGGGGLLTAAGFAVAAGSAATNMADFITAVASANWPK
jgi:hypothetical protein